MNRCARFVSAVILAALPGVAGAQVTLFNENFDVDNTANWTVNTPTGHATFNAANFFFDYSTIGIPAAPGSGGTTRGLKLEANLPGSATFTGLSVSPNGQSFAGDYTLRFHAWQNFNGPMPAGGNGSTQVTGGGVGTNGTSAQFPGNVVNGVMFGATGDGGSGQDYRAYPASTAQLINTSGAYAAGTGATAQNNTDPYYASFGNLPAPAAQLSLFPQQTGNTNAGTQAFAWHEWVINKSGSSVTWSIDGTLIATVDITAVTLGGTNIFLNYFDVNGTSSTDPNARSLLFGLIDNVTVSGVPEPGSLLLAGLAAPALLKLRRRRAT